MQNKPILFYQEEIPTKFIHLRKSKIPHPPHSILLGIPRGDSTALQISGKYKLSPHILGREHLNNWHARS